MEKTKKAVKYMIGVWDEVTGRTWRKNPDHVQLFFLEAEKELLNKPTHRRQSKYYNMTINQKIDYLFSKINWKDSALDAKSIQIMNELKSDIKRDFAAAMKQQAEFHHKVIERLELSDAYENNIPMSDLFENEILIAIELMITHS